MPSVSGGCRGGSRIDRVHSPSLGPSCGLDVYALAPVVQRYFQAGLAPSTQQTYDSGLKTFMPITQSATSVSIPCDHTLPLLLCCLPTCSQQWAHSLYSQVISFSSPQHASLNLSAKFYVLHPLLTSFLRW